MILCSVAAAEAVILSVFRHDCHIGADHMEGIDVRHRQRVAGCRRSLRKHGTWFQEGQFVYPFANFN